MLNISTGGGALYRRCDTMGWGIRKAALFEQCKVEARDHSKHKRSRVKCSNIVDL
jgi:hypothetical protein